MFYRKTFTPADKRYINEFFDKNQTLIQRLITDKENQYRVWFVNKGNGKKRKITEPLTEMKKMQKALKEIFQPFDNGTYTMGFRKNKSIRDNAKQHLGAHCVLNMDIKDFFPSVKSDMIYNALEGIGSLFNIASDHIEEIVELLTYKNELPQGSPASPTIANLVMRKGDDKIGKLLTNISLINLGYSYSRYADDITVSIHGTNSLAIKSGSSTLRDIIKPIAGILKKEGFRVNWQKTHVMTHSKQMNITGVIINRKSEYSYNKSEIARAPMDYKDRIRAILHNISTGKAQGEETEKKVIGMLSHLKSIDAIGYEKIKYDMIKVINSNRGSLGFLNHLKTKALMLLPYNRISVTSSSPTSGSKEKGIFRTDRISIFTLNCSEFTPLYTRSKPMTPKEKAKWETIRPFYRDVFQKVSRYIVVGYAHKPERIALVIDSTHSRPSRWQIYLYASQFARTTSRCIAENIQIKAMLAMFDFADSDKELKSFKNNPAYSMVPMSNTRNALIVL